MRGAAVPWHRRSASLLGAVVAAITVLGACTAGPSSRPEIVVNDGPGEQVPLAGDPTAVPVPPLEEAAPSFQWTQCAANLRARLAQPPLPGWLGIECARVNSPLDSPYAPGRGNTGLLILRAGSGPVPVVVVNDVDGLPGTIYAARLAATLPEDMLSRFSLVGVDRRGTGKSDPADCVPPEVRTAIVGGDPAQVDVEGWLEPARTAGQQCSITLESRLPALDTWRSSADLDKIREALGVERLTAIGHGEGSRVLTVFAERFPDRVSRMVLDGVPDPAQDAAIALEGSAAGAQATLQAFAADCANRACELRPDAGQAVPALVERLRTRPLAGPDGIPVTSGIALRAVLVGLADRHGWPALSSAIDKANRGDGSGLAALIDPTLRGIAEYPPIFDAGLVTGCNDTKTRPTIAQITTAARDWQQKYPVFGTVMAHRLALCGVWPVPSQPLPTPTAKGAPPIVVLGTASDPVTPMPGTERAAQQLTNATLVSWHGSGHGALGLSTCATDAARAFLQDGQVPRSGTACPP
jgi:pimeloyl-ACP methyl ester carboxylesterase